MKKVEFCCNVIMCMLQKGCKEFCGRSVQGISTWLTAKPIFGKLYGISEVEACNGNVFQSSFTVSNFYIDVPSKKDTCVLNG